MCVCVRVMHSMCVCSHSQRVVHLCTCVHECPGVCVHVCVSGCVFTHKRVCLCLEQTDSEPCLCHHVGGRVRGRGSHSRCSRTQHLTPGATGLFPWGQFWVHPREALCSRPNSLASVLLTPGCRLEPQLLRPPGVSHGPGQQCNPCLHHLQDCLP